MISRKSLHSQIHTKSVISLRVAKNRAPDAMVRLFRYSAALTTAPALLSELSNLICDCILMVSTSFSMDCSPLPPLSLGRCMSSETGEVIWLKTVMLDR